MKRVVGICARLGLSLSLAGCYSNPEKFNKHFADRVCDWMYECYHDGADIVWSSHDDCVDTYHEDLDDNEASCSYDADEARDCMDWVKDQKKDCSMNILEATLELAQRCDEVYYDCGSGLALDGTEGGEQLASFPDAD